MNYAEIKKLDIANGLGVRVSLFVSGCRNHCKGCFNKVAWDFNYGKPFTKETEKTLLEYLKPSYISGLTILGGEPFEEENQAALAPFLEAVRHNYPHKNIWCYSGYDYYKDILYESGAKHTEYTKRMLSCIDVIVDGRFVEEKKDLTLDFRGSSNQRIIKLIKS